MALATSYVKIDPSKLANFLRSPGGPVLRMLIERGEEVKSRAQARVGVDTGDLRDSIVKRIAMESGFPAIHVGVFGGRAVEYAQFHHDGTVPHEIVPRNAKVLVFEVGGSTVFTRHVNHPGTAPNPFLTDAARDAGLFVR